MKIFFITSLILFTAITNYAQTKKDTSLILEGIYTNKNIFVKNSFGPGGIGFCVTEIRVNGKITKDEINANLFQVHLDTFHLKTGDKIKIEIKHHKNCGPLASPLIMNPSAITSDTNSNMFAIEGKFMWQNLFVLNPYLSGSNYSVTEVKVNGKVIPGKINTEIFEINLNKLGLENEQKLRIEFKHEKLHAPLIINPEAIH
jgi:hypothetical protein